MDGKKISFGFSKITKKSNLLANKTAPKEDQKVDLIKCLEGQEIKLVEEKSQLTPLVIPLKENQKTSSALLSLIKRRAVLLGEESEATTAQKPQAQPEESVNAVNGNLPNVIKEATLEQRAAQELLADLKVNGEPLESGQLVLPIVKADELPLDGAKESTLDDYEAIPIQQFGVAMLRGMGWVAPPPKKSGPPVDEAPLIRPKGMGLGADKALKAKPLLVPPEANEVLEIKKQAFVLILGGKHKDLYGQIEGFDDHAGRVIVKMAIGGTKETFNEFLCQPVSRKEYAEYGKCINTAKYEEYKKLENEHGQILIKKENVKKEKKMESLEYIKQEEETVKRNYQQRMKAERSDSSNNSHKEARSKNEMQKLEHSRITASSENIHSQNSIKMWEFDDPRSIASLSARRHDNIHVKNPTDGSIRHKARSTERRMQKSHSSSKSLPHRAPSSDSSLSSLTDSDSDSAYERKHKKSKSKRKSKKCKSKARKHERHHADSSAENSESSASIESAAHNQQKSHKKKTKKSKKQRSRTRSRSRVRK